MNGFIFALLIIGVMYLRSQSTSLFNITANYKNESDMFKKEELAREIVWKVIWVAICSIGSIFYMPFVLMQSINWLFELELTYWWLFAVYLLYSQTLKSKNS